MTNQLSSNTTEKFSGINLACGGKLCREPGWVNGDHSPSTKDVIKINLLSSFPIPDNAFDVVYHSQFIEHLPHDKAPIFISECHRILKPNGVLRVVTPNLQNQAVEYLRNLEAVLNAPSDESTKLRYDWIRLEMLDQLSRHTPGGEMVSFLRTSGIDIRDYLWQRMGRSGENLLLEKIDKNKKLSFKDFLRKIRNLGLAGMDKIIPKPVRVGRFRLSGESHLCMYDEYLLSNLLAKAGFTNISKVSAKESRISNWDRTRLDCDDNGNPDGDVSLFMEAVKAENK
jgi:predicted SAM-dependent methyltransferase